MKTGQYYILVQPTGTTPYVLVGIYDGVDEDIGYIKLRDARCIRLFGANQFLAGLAANGPAKDTRLGVRGDLAMPLTCAIWACDSAKWAAAAAAAAAAEAVQ